MHKRITALLAVPALVAFGLAAATSANASTRPASVSAADHAVRSAAANALASPGGEQHARDAPTLEPNDLGRAHPGLPEQLDYLGNGFLCLARTMQYWCLTYSKEDTQATITDVGGIIFDWYYIRTISGDNTFTLGSGYNGLYAGDDVYCFEDLNGDYLSDTLEANGDVIVNGYAGSCTGAYDEWVQDGDWLINVGETDWNYAEGFFEYPYSSVMTSGCDNDTTCHVWVEESTAEGNNDNQWYFYYTDASQGPSSRLVSRVGSRFTV